MDVLLEFPNSHHYWQKYEKTKWFCPECGNKTVWEEQSAGDYYLGTDFVCTTCDSGWTMQGPLKPEDPVYMAIIEQLKEQKAKEPTTKEGR